MCGRSHRIGLETLRDLDIQLPLPIPGVNIEDARMLYSKREISACKKPVVVVYNRIEFDAYLNEITRQLEVVINEGEAIQEMALTESGMQVFTTNDRYLALVVVGADGSRGVSRMNLSQLGSQSNAARLLELFRADEIDVDHETRNSADFDFTKVKDGCRVIPGDFLCW